MQTITPRPREEVEEIAKRMGWALNPNERVVKSILKREGLLKQKYGEYYCPCRQEYIPENICKPCVWSPEEIKRDGHCHCNLFWDKQKAEEYIKA
ncbi:MAG: ferredoxin-thioredoxin reductase catalytic domain-containing protein, partial [Promethearchaeota archaeon]